MNITSISLSYVFIGIGVAALLAFVYFKIITVKTAPQSASKDKILGEMKHPDTWRNSNNTMAYVSLFWGIISVGIFIYLKYFNEPTVMPSWYLFAYAAVLAVSYGLFAIKKQSTAS